MKKKDRENERKKERQSSGERERDGRCRESEIGKNERER